MDGFVHLHVHSEYSLLDGANRIKRLVRQARQMGMDALALTDHGNLHGAIEFYTACRGEGVKPILGMEAYVSPTDRFDRSMGNIATAAYHLILLAGDATGWRNLMKLSSRSYLEGFYYRPRIDRALLREFGDGLICTTACLGGEVPTALLAGKDEEAERIAREYLDIFGPERFFVEIQNQNLPDQDAVNPRLVALASRLGVGLVGTNDVHFLAAEDKPSHEVLTCISTGKTLAEGGAIQYSPQLYLKDLRAMRQALVAWPEAADNTLRVADMCDLKLDFSGKYLPAFPTPDSRSPQEYLRAAAEEGLRRRLGDPAPPEYRQRLQRELEVIEAKGYSSYFLIVRDFVLFAQANDIPCGARGSGCATLLGYCLGISDVDPVRYGLLFERFTDPAREEDPDIDIDICQEGRGKVIQYVRQKYGHVAQIITFGTLKPRAAIRDVGRVLDMPLAEVDAIAKKVPEALGMTIEGALASEPALEEIIQADDRVRVLFEHARRLEGLARHASVHAAGVVIADQVLENLVPLYRQSDSDEVITQWDDEACQQVGLMKMDFLGLRTLTTIQRARTLVRERTGQDVHPERLPLDDGEVFDLFCQGRTDGVFQFESEGMKGVLMQMRPSRIEDLIAANAMYRPGPMELIPTYCARKNRTEPVPAIHPLVDDILAETYGIMVYQEQVMQVLNRLGRLPLNTALTLIKAISKKKEKVIAAERPNFLAGAKDHGIGPEEAERLFDLILRFAGYGFNKAHSTRYALIAYQTAYFKCRYPAEFMAALLTFESGDSDKVVQYMAEAQRMGIPVRPPDVNACGSDFTIDDRSEGDSRPVIRFGLAAVKGVGVKAVEAILQARRGVGRFRDLYHFCEHTDLRLVNRATIEALIKCGAFDGLGAHRAAMLAAVDHACQLGGAAAEDRRSGQLSFFRDTSADAQKKPPPRFPDVEPLSEAQLLKAEKDTLGFYVTGHPLVHYGRELESLSTFTCAALADLAAGTPVTLGCMIASVRVRVTKSGRSAGKKMAILTVEDLTGSRECVVFAEAYERLGAMLSPEAIVFLTGTVDRRREAPQVIVEAACPGEQAFGLLAGGLRLRPPKPLQAGDLDRLAEVLRRHPGRCPVELELTPDKRPDLRARVTASEQWFVAPSRELYGALCDLLGEENVLLMPRRAPNGNGPGWNGARRFHHPARPHQPSVFTPSGQAPG